MTAKGWIDYFMGEWNLNLAVNEFIFIFSRNCLNKLLPEALRPVPSPPGPQGPIQQAHGHICPKSQAYSTGLRVCRQYA